MPLCPARQGASPPPSMDRLVRAVQPVLFHLPPAPLPAFTAPRDLLRLTRQQHAPPAPPERMRPQPRFVLDVVQARTLPLQGRQSVSSVTRACTPWVRARVLASDAALGLSQQKVAAAVRDVFQAHTHRLPLSPSVLRVLQAPTPPATPPPHAMSVPRPPTRKVLEPPRADSAPPSRPRQSWARTLSGAAAAQPAECAPPRNG